MKGSILIIVSALFYASYGIWSKLMNGVFTEFNQAWTRALLLLIILIPFGILTRSFKKIKPKDFVWFAAVSLAGGLNQAPYFYGFKHLSIGTSTLLFYLMLIIGAYIIGKFFFNEKITSIKYFSLALAIIGLFVIYKFSLASDQILPAISTMIAGLMGSGIIVFSKKISSNYSETQILSSIFLTMLIGNLIFSFLFKEALPQVNLNLPWFAQFSYTLAMLIANALAIAGFKYLEPSIGSLIGLLEVIFAAFFGIIFFEEHLTIQFIVGSILILLAAGLSDTVSVINTKIRNTC